MRILITGASGFLGSHVVERLSRGGKHDLRLLLRKTSSLRYLDGIEYERAEGDILDPGSLADAVAGVDTVIHLAGATSGRSEAEFHAVNAGGTASLAVAAVAADVQRFVLVSSLAAQGPSQDGEVHDAEIVLPAPVSAYGRSKLAGEQAALVLAHELNVSVLRAPAIYGPRDKGFLLLFKLMNSGVMPLFRDGSNRLSWVYATDAASAVEAIATGETPSGRVYGVSDGGIYTWNDLVDIAVKALDKRVFRLRVPRTLYTAAAAGGSLGQLLTRKTLPLTLDKLEELRQPSWVVGYERLQADFGWEPEVTAEEGIPRTVAWYRENGWL
jgi:nucleoside-diphosphate-sugar epimerase